MFKNIAFGHKCIDKDYEKLAPRLRMRLFEAQRRCIDKGVPLLILVCGVDESGRGAVVNLLSEWMDSKFVHSHVFWMPSDEESERPEEWRYWRHMPGSGMTGVFYGGWYGRVLRPFACGDMTEEAFMESLRHWQGVEESLANSGMAIVKLWLHIDAETHAHRLKKRLKQKQFLHFTPYDKKAAESYDALVDAASRAITMTDRAYAPWVIVDAQDANYRNLVVVRAVVDAVDRAFSAREAREARLAAERVDDTGAEGKLPDAEGRVSALETVDLSVSVKRDVYHKELEALQQQLRILTYQAYRKGISSTLVFEGWDAAGKGGTIRRLQQGIDARISQTIPIGVPSSEELAHHYLWRFWRHIPRAGFVTIYDRSWYGRVLVERVEKLTPREDWSRAYAEINLFERQIMGDRNVLLKFWLHISPEEQLRRFKERETVIWKNYKITPDDWRNREKWPDYLCAADEMFLRTSTQYAPWNIVPAEDKKVARLTVLRTYRDALVEALDRKTGKKRQ